MPTEYKAKEVPVLLGEANINPEIANGWRVTSFSDPHTSAGRGWSWTVLFERPLPQQQLARLVYAANAQQKIQIELNKGWKVAQMSKPAENPHHVMQWVVLFEKPGTYRRVKASTKKKLTKARAPKKRSARPASPRKKKGSK